MNTLPSPPPHSKPIPAEEVRAGRRLTEALVALAAEHARDEDPSMPRSRRDALIVGALVTALASVSAAVARAHRFDLVEYEAFVIGYVSHVFQAESIRPVYQ